VPGTDVAVIVLVEDIRVRSGLVPDGFGERAGWCVIRKELRCPFYGCLHRSWIRSVQDVELSSDVLVGEDVIDVTFGRSLEDLEPALSA